MSGVELTTTALGTVDVANLVLRLPLHGNWVATMDIGQQSAPAPGDPASLALTRSDGTVDTFTGTVRRAQVTPGTQNLSVTVVGGSGHLLDVIPARHHTAGAATVPAGLVLRGIADAAVEALAAGVETALDAYPLQRWTRVRGEAGAALDNLAAFLGQEWRVFADGTVWMGLDTWPPVDASAFYNSGDPRDGTVIYIPDGAPYRPGTTIDGARVIECCYRITPGRPFMEARVAVQGDPVYPPPLTPYARAYACTVVTQNSDLTLNLTSGDPTLGDDLRNVPFKLGIPGTKVTVPVNSIVRVAFQDGLPDGIFAGDIDLDSTATKKFALLDDTVDSGSLAATVTVPSGGGTVAVNFVYKGGAPSTSISISGTITGPGHAYAHGVPTP